MTEAETEVSSTPSSTLLTFLLADIRGFTAYTHAHGDEAGARLSERFLALCREVIASFGGEVFGSAGDQALAAFSSARQAVRAAIALQKRLGEEQEAHPEIPLQAGIGLDAGDAVQVGGDYRGGAINLAARLCALAGKGEIFASEGVIKTARRTEGISFLDRGEVTVKGIEGAVRVLQIAPEGELPDELPPLQPLLVTAAHNLPDEPTPFVGRETDIADVVGRLSDQHVRLLTLTGPGGSGKTRLAVQVGAKLLESFPQGVYFVSLASLSDVELVPSAIATVLGLKEVAGHSLSETLSAYLHDKCLLLVLDNFEHLLAAAPLVADLLACCPRLSVLVTSRANLHLSREHEYPVPPLAVPDLQHLPDLDTLSQYDAVRLFIERVQAVKPGFSVTNENAPAVAEICSRLDGLPLALELAAARVRLFPPQALLQRLQNRLQLLTGGARDRPSRQQTLRGAIEWSYDLLSQEEQILFARLSVFAGGCTFEATEAVCNPEGELDLLEGMASLVEKSLLRQEGEEEPRFQMLETIREYAAGELADRGEDEQVRHRHAEYFRTLMEESEAKFRAGQDDPLWVARMDQERDNLRESIAWLLQAGKSGPALELAWTAALFWESRGYWREGRRWLERTLTAAGGASPKSRGKGLAGLGLLASRQGDAVCAESSLEEALTLFRALDDRWWTATALTWLAIAVGNRGDGERAETLYQQALVLFQELGERHLEGTLLYNLGILAWERAEFERAEELLTKSLNMARSGGAGPQGVAQILFKLGRVLRDRGDYRQARLLFREALHIAQQVGPAYNRFYLTVALDDVAGLMALEGGAELAARVFGAADALREGLGAQLPASTQKSLEHFVDMARARVDAVAWTRAWEEGRAMTPEQAVHYALNEPPDA